MNKLNQLYVLDMPNDAKILLIRLGFVEYFNMYNLYNKYNVVYEKRPNFMTCYSLYVNDELVNHFNNIKDTLKSLMQDCIIDTVGSLLPDEHKAKQSYNELRDFTLRYFNQLDFINVASSKDTAETTLISFSDIDGILLTFDRKNKNLNLPDAIKLADVTIDGFLNHLPRRQIIDFRIKEEEKENV